jgi:hypothetical protein
MKYQTLISLVAGIGLVAGPLTAMASGFGGGWMRDGNSGSIYNSSAPTVVQPQHPASTASHKNGFGDGWARNPNSGTIYNTNASTVDQQRSTAVANTKTASNKSGFGGGWARGNFGTISYDPS